MIITCQACQRKYRLDAERLQGRRRLRCTRCGHVFAIDAPPRDRPVMEVPPLPEPKAPVSDLHGAGPAGESAIALPSPAAVPARVSSERPCEGTVVLLAEPQDAIRQKLETALADLGCRVEFATDGAAAFRFAVARRPALMVLDSNLPGLSGESICEGVKGSPHLRQIKVVLVGTGDGPDWKERGRGAAGAPDDDLAGSLPESALRERLLSVLRGDLAAPVEELEHTGALAEAREEPPQAPEVPAAMPIAVPEDAAEAIAPVEAASPAAGAQAEIRRLARIMLSDLKLYNPDRFERALHEDQLLETFQAELARGRDLITHRFPDVPDRLDLLTTALREEIEQERTEASSPPHAPRLCSFE